MIPTMRYALMLIIGFCAYVTPVHAHVPLVVEQESLHDITVIEDADLSQAFYGTLTDFPHTYEIRAKEPFHLYAEVLVPDIEGQENVVSGIIIKETGHKGRVEEVTRMLAKDASWESFFEPWGADSYRKGGVFERDVEPGVYRIELSTPNNHEKYVLVVGKREDFWAIGYFETIGRLMDVKTFFGKSKFRVIESPLVYVPLLTIALIILVIWMVRRKRDPSVLVVHKRTE